MSTVTVEGEITVSDSTLCPPTSLFVEAVLPGRTLLGMKYVSHACMASYCTSYGQDRHAGMA